MIADMINNKKLNPKVNDLFIRDKKLNISIVVITQSNFKMPKEVRISTTHFFYYENSKQNRISTNYIKSFIRHWLHILF